MLFSKPLPLRLCLVVFAALIVFGSCEKISSDGYDLIRHDGIEAVISMPTAQSAPRSVAPQSRPNIIFIFQDDLGFGDLACYGHPYAQTPNLDRLAAAGTMFRNFHVSGVTCNPSRTGFMTSRHPATFPNYMASFGFQGVTTITDVLKQNGYATAHVGKWHIGPKSTEKNGTYSIDHVQVLGGRKDDPQGKDSKIYAAAITYLKHHHSNYNGTKPLYMNVWGYAAHMDVKPHANLVRKFNNVKMNEGSLIGKFMRSKLARRGDKTDGMMRKYLAEVWAMDTLIGNLLHTIDELGISDNTIIMFSADQGPSSGAMGYSGGLRGEKLMQWEGGTRVPFIIRWPGHVPADHVNCHSAISALDYMPSLLSLLGIPFDPTEFEGENLADVLLGNDRSRVNPIFHKVSSNNPETMRAMLYGRWKMHWNARRNPELYDITTNPDENINVYSQNPYVGAAMQTTLAEWDSTLPSQYAQKKWSAKREFNPETKPIIIGPPDGCIVENNGGINNPPLHEQRCLSEMDVE